ncbi:carbohydrate kinase [Rhodococcus pyridinivorans]|uniref:carbohydrate kinase family protein n=1 Tax=Rhodococcus pyridinivorans TaxID=103816 RepID=UPI00200A1342|nr:carbohydrate kinase [Rhodococcus pyridinivorans]UPW03775.1 carbohydrate kinase [Rhodococcus pyridinivorans]
MNGHALVVGEALVDIVHRGGAEPVEHVGGSPLNVALGLGRLGRPVQFTTRVGTDARGRRIVDHLAASGVSLTPGSAAAERTATAQAEIDEKGSATYEFDIVWDPVEPPPSVDAVLVHTGSIATVLEPGCDLVAELVAQQAGTSTVSFDPNVRPALIDDPARGRERIERLVSLADVVKASDEDLTWFAPDRDPLDTARDWLSRGPAIVAVTRGEQGAVALCAAGTVEVPAVRVEVVDTVGAGDAFTTGLLDGLWTCGLLGADRRERLRGIGIDDVREVFDIAAWTSGLTVARAGADLPTLADRTAAREAAR